MANYYKVMLGKGSMYASQGFQHGFIGIDDSLSQDLSPFLAGGEAAFRAQVANLYHQKYPAKTKVTVSQVCTTLWRIAQNIQVGDVVLCPTGEPGQVRIGDVIGGYSYQPGQVLPHRRAVQWRAAAIQRTDMSLDLQNSSGGIQTIIDLSKYAGELEALSAGQMPTPVVIDDEVILDPASFQLENQLEAFLVSNWASTELGQKYDIYTDDDGIVVGQQFRTDTGPLDILAVSKDKSELLVVELKRGRASDAVVGQIQRYMGFVQDELAEYGQSVRGAIIALEDDLRIRRALRVAPNITFYTYQISFKLKQMGVQA